MPNLDFKEVKEYSVNKDLESLKEHVLKSKHTKIHSFHKFIDLLSESFVSRKKNPDVKNIFNFVFSGRNYDLKRYKESIVRKCNIAQTLILQNKNSIVNNIANKIVNGSCILTHGNTDFLIDAFKKAKQEGKKFNVIVTDSPFSELGSHFFNSLRKESIHPLFIPIAGLKSIINKVDFFIFGADFISVEGMIAELGVELISEIFYNKGLPVYAVSTSWKVHDDLGLNDLKHVALQKRKGSHSFFKQSFEQINPSFVSGVISEKGTHSCSVFVDFVNKERKNSRF